MSMGFKVERKILNLRFEEYEGMEVRARTVSFGQLMDVAEEAETLRADGKLGKVRGFLDLFTSRLESWNLEDEDDRPVPATSEGLLSLDTDMALAILLGWFDAMTAVAPSLGKDSISGPRFPEGSIPMERLSASQAS